MRARPGRARLLLAAAGAVLALGVLSGALAGCASVPPPAPAGGLWTASAPRDTAGRGSVLPDTLPSREAREVLATIPEPLAPGEVVPAPAVERAPAPSPSSEADTARAEIPVPAPVPVLGERPLPQVISPTDTSAPSSEPPAALAPPPSSAPAASPRGAAAHECWRVQIQASSDRAKALRYQNAGASQLLVPMTIAKENRLFKVRTRDCMDRAAAEALKRRAASAGFRGVFLLEEKRP